MAHQISVHAILLQDIEMENTGVLAKIGLDSRIKIIPKGELVSQMYDEGRGPDYCLVSNPSVTLNCTAKDVAPLTDHEFHLLEAIQSQEDRYAVFMKDCLLEWGQHLKLTSYVYVTLPGKIAIPQQRAFAVVGYIGPLGQKPGVQFGVEIVEREYCGCGTTDGFFDGNYYFRCEENCGLFVSLDKLSPDPDPGFFRPKPDKHRNIPGHSKPAQQSDAHNISHVTAKSQAKKGSQESDCPPCQFKLGDRVVIYNRIEQAVHGTVRWLDKINTAQGTINGVGIETDTHVRLMDFMGVISGVSKNFKLKDFNHGKIVIAEFMVVSEEGATKVLPKKESTANPSSTEERLAQHYGESISQQHEAIQKANKARELEYLRKAVETKALNHEEQERILHELEEKRKAQRKDGERHKSQSSNYSPATQRHLYKQGKESHLEQNSASQQDRGVAMNTVPLGTTASSITTERLTVGSAIQIDNPDPTQPHRYGVIRWIGELPGLLGKAAGIELEEYMEGCTDGTWGQTGQKLFCCPAGKGFFCPLQNLRPDKRFLDRDSASLTAGGDKNQRTPELTLGSTIQIQSSDSTQPHIYGVIRWIGELPGIQGKVAGIELEEYMEGCSDGTFPQTGQKFFNCPNGKGIYYPLLNLKPVDTNERLQQRVSHLENLMKKKTKTLQEKDSELNQLRSKLTVARNESSQLTRQLERLEQQHQQDQKDARAQSDQQRQQIREASNQYQHLQEQYRQLQQELTESREFSTQLQQRALIAEQRQQQMEREKANVENVGTLDVNFTQLQAPPLGPESWNVPRDQVDICEQIGHGAWGTVSKGYFNHQLVAIKRAHREILDQPYTIAGLKREIQIMAHVQHPNLVRFIAAVIDEQVERGENTPLLIVELLDINLRQAYKATNLGTNTIPIFRDVAYGLHYLHEHAVPIIHRDVSAPNVLLEKLPGGMYRAKLSDFGSANKAKDAKTLAGGAIGYSAPETFPQIDPDAPLPPQTPKIDVFSYGILLAEVITKTMPTAENRSRLARQVPGNEMRDLISACVKPNPSDRLTMASVLNKLNRIPTPRPRSRPST